MAFKKFTKGSTKQLSTNFKAKEFDCKCGEHCQETMIDDKLVVYLQKIREHFDAPVSISSGFRCSTHNKNVGGATNSYHMKGQAADIKVKGVEPAEVAKYAESIGILGIGLYDTFTHVDTRTKKSFWYSSKEEYRETFGGSNTVVEPEPITTTKITIALPTTKRGDKNLAVKLAQSILCLVDDGIFGKQTQTAVVNFQQKNGLSATGIIDANTWKVLFKDL